MFDSYKPLKIYDALRFMKYLMVVRVRENVSVRLLTFPVKNCIMLLVVVITVFVGKVVNSLSAHCH